jgi:HSP20 family protein
MPFFDRSSPGIPRFRAAGSRSETFASRLCPPADIYRTKDGWIVKLELAGVGKNDLQVVRRDGTLIVYGRGRDTLLTQGCEYVSLEISYSEFERQIELPCNLVRSRINVETREGMVFIHILPEATL